MRSWEESKSREGEGGHDAGLKSSTAVDFVHQRITLESPLDLSTFKGLLLPNKLIATFTGGKGSLTQWVHCDYIVII